jgi:DNA-binding NarL/FixJ family response regulator
VLTESDEYSISRNAMDNGASGFISKNALPEEIIYGIEALKEGKSFIGGKIAVSEKEAETDLPEWLAAPVREILEYIEKDSGNPETIGKLSLIIESLSNYRKFLITEQLKYKEITEAETVNEYLKILIDNLLLKGYSNWEIAGKLNLNTDTIRVYRMDLILKLGAKSSMMFAKKKNDDVVKFTPREMQLLRLIAAGFTNKEIAGKLYLGIETIKKFRKDLISKSSMDNTMKMIMAALRQGLIKLEDIDKLTQKD